MVIAMAYPLFLVFILLPFCSVAQTNGNIAVGASLSATDKGTSSWVSPSGDFAFGFRQLENKDLFLVSIWYDKIPDRTIVWYANGDNPAPKGSKLELTADRGLVLNGKEIWKSDYSIGVVAFGFMNDTGNFVLANQNSEKIWESFSEPTDTLLPAQKMSRGGVLSSRLTDTNFSRGRFRLRLLTDGNLVLNTNNLLTNFDYDAYYRSDTADSDPSNSGYQLVFNESGSMYILRSNSGRLYIVSDGQVPAAGTNFYYRATLNFDGVFVMYYHPKTSTSPNNGSWSVVKYIPENICLSLPGLIGSGVCGYNSICRLGRDQRPRCECPPGFSLLDPNDKYGSCKPDFIQSCEEDGEPGVYGFEELTDTGWPNNEYDKLKNYDAEDCNKSCLHDCFCVVATLRDGACWKKRLPLSNGRVDNNLPGKAFIKIRKGDFPTQNSCLPIPDKRKNQNQKQDTSILVLSVLLGSSVFVNFILVAVVCLGFFFIYRQKITRKPHGHAQSVVKTNLRFFTYKELVEATNDFKEELGRGSFGIVYKGVIDMGCREVVAVKKLDRVIQDAEREFRTEVDVIGQTHHKNLVRLLGFCDEGPHRLLVYEFLSNGSLASFLFGVAKPSWKGRTQIAFGIARGLLYLHEECSTQIIHCDIKPQNILLDDYHNARISDFGLAKLLMMDQSQTQTGIRGTKGYVAPEWFRNLPITAKVDVYSFGVLLLEIICCRRNIEMEHGEAETAVLTYWAYDCYREGTLDALVEYDTEAIDLERFVMVAIWCIQDVPSLRPVMKKVIQMLEGVVEVPVPPCPSLFSASC
uniref:Receptor-like serine/threonine-protein kinase n=1 Tax=Davidia involucrata TaxID=16924 RepID=A0A5B6Z0S8_DAVIN